MASFVRRCARRLLGRHLPGLPPVRCEVLQLGGPAYGAWVVCPDRVPRGGLVYSFGVGEDLSWDLAMIERFDVTVHAFDPTPRSIAWVRRQSLPEKFVFHAYGIAARDGEARMYPPRDPAWVSHTLLAERRPPAGRAIDVQVRRLATIMAELGHRSVDLIKMDVEGAEFAIVDDLLRTEPAAGGASQLLIEFHHRFPGKRPRDTRGCIRSLGERGFRAFHVSSNQEDWSFVRDG